MIELGSATADEVVLAFVRAEVDSSRFGECYHRFLKGKALSRAVLVDEADLGNATQNAARAEMLRVCRGYPGALVFKGFPDDIKWRRIELEPSQLARVKYANYADWTALSGGTRRVVDAVANAETSSDTKRVEPIKGIVKRLRAGYRFAELIAVEQGPEDLVLVEGHARATAYAMARPPYNVQLLLGSSTKLSQWAFYPRET